jgi:DNA mismatch repair protein MutL
LRDRQFQHALRMAYQDRLYPGRYPAWVLYLEMDPERFDINVHPTKHEARFREVRLVHDFIFSAARAALESGVVIPIAAADTARSIPPADVASGPAAVTEPPAPEDRYRPTGPGRVLGRIQGRFVLAENNRALVVIDLLRAVELVTLARLRKAASAGRLRARPLLLPVTLAIDAPEAERFEHSAADLADLGIVLEWVAPERLSVRGLPALLPAVDASALLRELLAVCSGPPSGTGRITMRERWFAIMAGHAGRAAAADGNRLELDELWRELATLDIAGEGRPWRELGAMELARLVAHGC